MSTFEALRQGIESGREVTYEEFQELRARAEEAQDLLDMLGTNGRFVRPNTEAAGKANGPALAIVIGHTKIAQGASGGAPINQSEYVWNTDLAQKIMAHCNANGTEAKIFTRDGVGISGAYANVKSWGPACIVELHFNAFNNTARGTETLYDKDRLAATEAWANLLQSAMLKALDLADRGLKEIDPGGRGYGSVSALSIPTALIEPFFGDNAQDAAIAQAKKDDLAKAIADSAFSYIATM